MPRPEGRIFVIARAFGGVFQTQGRRTGKRERQGGGIYRARLAHEIIDDAARAATAKEVGQCGVFSARALQGSTVGGAGGRLICEQEGAADLYRIRAKLHCGAHAGGVADAARSHHRQRHRAADVRQEGKQPALRVRVVIEKPAAMPARFQSLRDDAVRAVCFQPACFGHAGRA